MKDYIEFDMNNREALIELFKIYSGNVQYRGGELDKEVKREFDERRKTQEDFQDRIINKFNVSKWFFRTTWEIK